MWSGHTYVVHANELVTIGSVTAASVVNWVLGNKSQHHLNQNAYIFSSVHIEYMSYKMTAIRGDPILIQPWSQAHGIIAYITYD